MKHEQIRIEMYAEDGRLTEPSDGIKYDIRTISEKVSELGRPLSIEEARKFILK